ncbi:MAG: hypothetical protein ACM3MF_10430 [Anaerolineae bacterium]
MDKFGKNQDEEVIKLLGKLKNAGPEYPPRLYAARRAAVIAGLVALPLAGAAAASWFARLVKLVKSMGMIDKIVLAAEVTAVTGLTVYGAVTAYTYRDAIKQLLLPGAGNATPFPSLSAPVNTLPPVQPTLTGSETPTPTGTLTAVPPAIAETPQPGQTQVVNPTEPPTQAAAQPTKTNPGLHLGQTKTPSPPGTP